MHREIIRYSSCEAAEYFSSTRVELSQFYATEQNCINFMIDHSKSSISILDIGCAAGLGNALLTSFPEKKIQYSGVDINSNSIQAGKEKFPGLNINHADFAEYLYSPSSRYTHIISLSCIDWNTSFEDSLKILLKYCRENRVDFCFSFRSSDVGNSNLSESYQFVNYNGQKQGEIAGYVVLSFDQLKSIIEQFSPSYAYIDTFTGPPSSTAVTPYDKLIFGCMLLSYSPALPEAVPQGLCNEVPIYGSASFLF